MKILYRTHQFKKEFKLIERNKDQKKLTVALDFIANDKTIPAKYKDRKLIGNYEGLRELHIEADWLLIYRITKDGVFLERTDTHSDLFKQC